MQDTRTSHPLMQEYVNYLKTEMGYTGQVETLEVNPCQIMNTMWKIRGKMKERSALVRRLNEQEGRLEEYDSNTQAYTELRKSLIRHAKSLLNAASNLPQLPYEATTSKVDSLEDLCQQCDLTRSHLWIPAHKIELAREAGLAYKTDKMGELADEVYALSRKLLGYMGIMDPKQIGICDQYKAPEKDIALAKTLESAHWLTNQVQKLGHNPWAVKGIRGDERPHSVI